MAGLSVSKNGTNEHENSGYAYTRNVTMLPEEGAEPCVNVRPLACGRLPAAGARSGSRISAGDGEVRGFAGAGADAARPAPVSCGDRMGPVAFCGANGARRARPVQTVTSMVEPGAAVDVVDAEAP
jgi:hypothetical protein